eukprot:TRINITY_DN1199_c0_g1_i1.p1 TRINITY_DN1199_c0_g1~~TRINITY_DN1199_c0_g1_i1.p1  ORF type:complete len:305 (-),score=34.26 TRINITY_DN1199_c0_g1_i1:541-1455(-)
MSVAQSAPLQPQCAPRHGGFHPLSHKNSESRPYRTRIRNLVSRSSPFFENSGLRNVFLDQGFASALKTLDKASLSSRGRRRGIVTMVIPFERATEKEAVPPDLTSFLYLHRIIYLGTPITSYISTIIIIQLLYLNAEKHRNEPMYLYINSTGTVKGAYKLGFESEALTIYDVMGRMVGTICTLAVGLAWGEAALLLAAGRKNRRGALHSASIMLRQPLGRVTGKATLIDNERKNLTNAKLALIKLFARHTGRSKEKIEEDMNHGKYLSPQEAIDYGLIDKVIRSKKRADRLMGAYDPEEEDLSF